MRCRHAHGQLDPAVAGLLASAALAGMFLGGYLFGVVGDRHGRKPAFLACLTLFSAASRLAAITPTPALFGLARFVAGIGVGGVVPVAASLTSEYTAPGKANRQFTLMYTGDSPGERLTGQRRASALRTPAALALVAYEIE